MAENTGGLRRALGRAGVYSFVQRALGAEQVRRRFLADHVRPVAGERVLDLGCGPGDILALLPDVDYVGVDVSAEYIDAARARFADRRARFVCADVRTLALGADSGGFDAVISIGVVHHLDDEAAGGMVGLAARVLAPGGRLVTLDPGRVEGQARFARWLIERDRGLRIRRPQDYEAIAGAHFGAVKTTVHHDLARVPYTHVAVECRQARG